MLIKIAERIKPFSHIPGTKCLLPFSTTLLEIFPTLIRFYSLVEGRLTLENEISLNLSGPIKEFTVESNLEIGVIHVWGFSLEGYFYYTIKAINGMGRVFVKKSPVNCLLNEAPQHVENSPARVMPRLSLGNHKSQDWDLVNRRLDLTEVFPAWHRLGQCLPETPLDFNVGTEKLLRDCQQCVDVNRPEQIVPAWRILFQTAFEGILVPHRQDFRYLGTFQSIPSEDAITLGLLSYGSRLIQELFIKIEGSQVHILPSLPPEFHSGKMINLVIPGGKAAIEWSKKTIRRLELWIENPQTIQFNFRNNVSSFRLKKRGNEQGVLVACGDKIDFEWNHYYLIDNFR